MRDVIRARWCELRLVPDGAPRPDAPFARGPLAARVLAGLAVNIAHALGVPGLACAALLPRTGNALAAAASPVPAAVGPVAQRPVGR
jgi:hypothetical protein